ncbi:zinc finger protein basonuclin-1 isoform X2 [Silurus meridionalis]|uniref:zinc finger protein basonuclin-1 isoform X2 n=1 Tax=Silurus meridionalis TaxID=175797 RepID=UPI001EEA3582|nr:zinc finger protein basonuclin-1 isoform X2 [Silurus meridionalis]
MSQAICCTLLNCSCDSFRPGKLKRRQCENCRHGWVAHALSKLKMQHTYDGGQVEIVHSNVVFDICSLMLYGTQAIPVRLKILLDRLFSVLKQDEVIKILSALDWTLQDYIRGYVLQDVAGKVLDRWAIMTFEEEIATLQQFLRFGETKSIVELMALQDKEGQAIIVPTVRANSDIRSFIESSMQRPSVPSTTEPLSRSNGHHFESLVNNMSFMLPLQLLNSVPAPLLRSRADSRQQEVPARPEILDSNPDTSSHFTSDAEREDVPMERASTNLESDDFTLSDNYSSPSTPCTPSISSDIAQGSPESKVRPGVGMKKGRVFCSACEKTFYDKGTLKIHYNAVHLKIKHKCTIEGCNMVFSSLRSRNRHSANPNPRLHMPMNRNNRDRDMRDGLSPGEEAEKRDLSRPVSSYISNSEPKLHSSFPSISHSGIVFPNLKTVQPVLPFYRSLVTPAELANTPGNLPSLPLLSSSSVPVSIGDVDSNAEPVPKKKSRKSSMPIKIEKDELEERSSSNDDDDDPPASKACEMDCVVKTECDEHGVDHPSIHSSVLNHSSHTEEPQTEKKHQAQGCSLTNSLSSFSNMQRDLHEFEEQTCSEVLDLQPTEEVTLSEPNHLETEVRTDGVKDLQMLADDEDDLLHHCDSCNKTFKNSYSARMHYCSVHLKEMHMCTVAGCNAAFPSRRSRDRHSANLNLHHKLLTKDHYIFTPSCRDLCTDSHPELPPKDPLSQTSVIFKGTNRMGLVFPMSKSAESVKDLVEDEAVLDLSTRGSGHSSSLDSDVGSEEELPLEDSDENESCDGVNSSLVGLGQQVNSSSSPITCHVCQKVYSNKGTFRAHYKTVHLRLLHKCKEMDSVALMAT